MGNMPVLKDLIVDMDAVHWKKMQRVTPWLLPDGAAAGARVHRPARVDDRRHADDGLHPVRRLRVGLPLDGGRPAVHRPGRARQGLPLRRRPARRPARGAPQGPRRGPARHLRLHPLLQLHRGLPQGRRADEPDHAPAADRRRRPRDRRPQQRPPPRAWRSSTNIEKNGLLHEADLLPDSYGGKFHPRAVPELLRSLPGDPEGAAARQGDAEEGAAAPAQGATRTSSGSSTTSTTRTSATSSTSTSWATRTSPSADDSERRRPHAR